MQHMSSWQEKTLFHSTYNLLSSSTLLRSLVTWTRIKHTVGLSRQKQICVCDGVGVRFSPHTSATSVSPCDQTSQTPAGTSNHTAHWSCPWRKKYITRHCSSGFVRLFQKCWRTSVCLHSDGQCLGLCVWQLGSSSSSLSQSLSYLLSSGQPNLTNIEDRFTVWQVICCLSTSLPYKSQHVNLR